MNKTREFVYAPILTVVPTYCPTFLLLCLSLLRSHVSSISLRIPSFAYLPSYTFVAELLTEQVWYRRKRDADL